MVARVELEPIKVLCVDDNVIIGMAMRATIDATNDMKCVDCLERADALLEAVAELQPDVVLLDLHMPGRGPLEALRDVTRDYPDVAVIVLSGSGDSSSRDEALAAGARTYLTKGGSSQPILAAIRALVVRNT
jgi:DNA-binding NarL/FixJ family response regulator